MAICIGAAWAGGYLNFGGGNSAGGNSGGPLNPGSGIPGIGGLLKPGSGTSGDGSGSAAAGNNGAEQGGDRLGFDDAGPSRSFVEAAPERIPDYDGRDRIELNGNRPGFTKYDREHITGEIYSECDSRGRCGSASALLHWTMMPKTERGEISDVRPTGWRQKKYPGIIETDPPFLYHRCHLIAYALTGQNANAQNLITGTEHMNMDLMRPLEVEIVRYLDDSNDHVLYRVTPYFKGREELARGVEIEALSLEDNGRSICYHVFLYNVQPGIRIDYTDGSSEKE